MLFGDTADAHLLVKAVDDGPLQKRLVEQLYEQSISHGKSLFDRASLALIAAQAGVPTQVVQRTWSMPQLHQLVQQDEWTASNIASGVPLFVFGNGAHIAGAQSQEVFRQALERLHFDSLAGIESSNGQAYSLDGCDI